MSLTPLLQAPALVQAHAVAAMGAFLLGLVQLAAPKGTLPHRQFGWLWVGLMVVVTLSSFGITGRAGAGNLSWIHILSAGTLMLLPLAVHRARRGAIKAHQGSMLGLFLGALVVTGAFTLMPGRLMHRVVFGG